MSEVPVPTGAPQPPQQEAEGFTEASEKILEEMGFIKAEDRPNPYKLSLHNVYNGLNVHGCRVPNFTMVGGPNISPVDRLKQVRALPIRDDDVVISAYPKSGTHWLWEVVHMLVHGTTKYEERIKEFNMLEFADLDLLESDPSPRVLNSHLWTCHLPQGILEKKTKMIHVIRNPKDVVVSYYHHLKANAQEGFTFDGLLQAVMENMLASPNQFEYLRHMAEYQKSHPDHPIKLVHFEEMKKDPVRWTKEIAEFLEVAHTEEFCRDVAAACSFDNMKKADLDKRRMSMKIAQPRNKINQYRKGGIGDWKNHFTVAQNEVFDNFISKELEKGGLDCTFVYT